MLARTFLIGWSLITIMSTADAIEDTGAWVELSVARKLANQRTFGLDLQSRWLDNIGQIDRTVLRPSLSGHRGALGWTLGYDLHLIDTPHSRREHRLWQQLHKQYVTNRTVLTVRLRVEERHIEGIGGNAIRPRLGIEKKWRMGRWLDAGNYLLRNEVFYNVNSLPGGPRRGFDQNRLFLGIAFTHPKDTKLTVGYQWQVVNQAMGSDAQFHQLILSARQMF